MNISNEIQADKELQEIVELFASQLSNYIDKVSVLMDLLQNIDPERSQKLLASFPEDLRQDVTENSQRQDKEHWSTVLADLLEQNINRLTDKSNIYNNNFVYNRISSIIQKLDYQKLSKIKEIIDSFYPEYTVLMERTITTMDDLLLLSKWDLQRVMKNCQPKIFAQALCNCNQKLLDFVLGNLSSHSRQDFLQLMDAYKDDLTTITNAQKEVIHICHVLEDNGFLVLNTIWCTSEIK